ncbi:MAG: VanW family protein [Bacillota bacterium]|jgi:vancomycin resistance protein YoaR
MRVRVIQRRRRGRRPVLVLAGALIFFFIIAGVLMRQEVIGENVWVLGVPLGGLSPTEAVKAVLDRAKEIQDGPLEFVAGDRVCQVTSHELKILLDESSLRDSVEQHVVSRPRILPVSALRKGPQKVLAAPAQYVSSDFDGVLAKVAENLSVSPMAARYGFDGKELQVLPPMQGQTVTPQDVRDALDLLTGTRLDVKARPAEAPDSRELPRLTLLSEFSTQYDVTETDRNVNLALAAEAVHGQVLWPGEVYSFNKTAGERTEAKGYRYANVVVGDHLEPGLAGGICQVTTTLFNAAAQAGLDFQEIHAHGIPVDYVEPGLDAAVAWAYLDLKIRNGKDCPVVFGAWVEEGLVAVRVYGEEDGYTYQLEPAILKEFPEEGKNPGLLVETCRVKRRDGQAIEKVLVVRSLYLASFPHPK